MTVTDVAQSGTSDANGAATLTFRPRSRQNWTVTQVSVSTPDVGGGASCAVYRDTYLVSPLVAQADAAAGDPPILVRMGQSLRVVWTGCVAGKAVNALVIYDDGN